jgi:DNA polymerase-1
MLYGKYRAELLKRENAGALNVFYHLLMPASEAFEKVEANGVYVDLPKYTKVEQEIRVKVTELEAQLKQYADINWRSTQQVGKFLFSPIAEGGLGLKPVELTATGRAATGEGTLKALQGQHPCINLKLEYNKYAKLLSTYIEGWKEFIMPNSRMYSDFNLAGTDSGRLSCSNPNVQNLPRDTLIRSLISAPEGWSLLEIDQSQVELRIAAMLANETEMLKIFNEGKDIHTNTAKLITGKSEVTKDERSKAKAVGFGFLYGMGAKTFKEYAFTDFNQVISLQDAQMFRDKYFAAYPELTHWHDRCRDEVRIHQSVRTLTGRTRRLLDILSPDQGKSSMAERQAINNGVQSFASDITLSALIEMVDTLNPSEAKVVATVHDSILLEVRNDKVDETIPKIKAIMEHPKIITDVFKINITVPLIGEVKNYKNKGWGAE